MNKSFQLQYIKHRDIDTQKWDKCVENSSNRRIYAMSWHLDRTAELWDALVLGDYDFVMPLPVKKRWGIKYLIQPLFSQQLGIFPVPTDDISRLFFEILTAKFRYFDIQLNAQNKCVLEGRDIDFIPLNNMVLPLLSKYSQICSKYSLYAKQRIERAQKNELKYISGISLEEYLEFKKANSKVNLNGKEIQKLKSLIALGQYKSFGKIYGIYSKENELCAAAYFCRFKERVTYINAVTNEPGRRAGAMFFLIDNFISENAGKNLVLDFEGSMIKGVARFFESFGSSVETYFHLKYNRLPLPFKWLKH